MKNTNNEIFAKNLKFYMEQKKVDRYQLCEDLGFKYSTVCEWLSANKYPRMDKIEMLAKYFEINKSDLIEEKDFIIDNFYQSMKQHIYDTTATLNYLENKPNNYLFISSNGGIGKSKLFQNIGGEGVKKSFEDSLKLLHAYAYLKGYEEANLENLEKLLACYDKLNSEGVQEAIKRVKELTYLPDYKKSDDDKTDTPAPDLLTTKK